MTDALHAAAEVRMLCLGDSYTIGEGVRPDERWSEQLAGAMREHGVRIESPTIVARTGWTTDELSAGIDAVQPGGTFDLVTLLVGVNDQYRGRSVDDFRPRFTALMNRAVAFAGARANRVLVLSIPDWGATPFGAERDREVIAAAIDAFNDAVRGETARAGARFIDVTPLTRGDAARMQVAADGLHPSAAMYGEWSRLALPAVLEMLGVRLD